MRIIYIADIRLPTEKAHGVQIMKMCEAFAAQGSEIELVVPRRNNPITEDPFGYYAVAENFKITTLSVPDTVGWGRFGFFLHLFLFGRAASAYIKTTKPDVVYGRDALPLLLSRRVLPNVVWESHTGAWNRWTKRLTQYAKIVVISQGLKDFYVEQGVPTANILVAHDGVDLQSFEHPQSKDEARPRLGLPADKKIALYIGRLDGWKGTDTLFKTAPLVSPALVAVIGGEPAQVEKLKKEYPLVTFLGYKPYKELADNQAAADVLVLPNTGKDVVSVKFTSPLKLFTYMASNRPIVASNLPSILEVLDADSAVLVEPDNPQALADGIKKVLSDESLAQHLSANALKKVQEYTWAKRAQKILSFIV